MSKMKKLLKEMSRRDKEIEKYTFKYFYYVWVMIIAFTLAPILRQLGITLWLSGVIMVPFMFFSYYISMYSLVRKKKKKVIG